MFYQHLVDFLLWLSGCLLVIGCVGGLGFLACLFAYGIHGKYDGRYLWWLDDYYHDGNDDYHGKRSA